MRWIETSRGLPVIRADAIHVEWLIILVAKMNTSLTLSLSEQEMLVTDSSCLHPRCYTAYPDAGLDTALILRTATAEGDAKPYTPR